MEVSEAIEGRASVRAFLNKPVSSDIIERIIDIARWAPSAANTQPWQVAVVAGETKDHLSAQLIQAAEKGVAPHPEFPHYPEQWIEPYKTRRFVCGMALYNALGIKREDKPARKKAWINNYRFFGAPVGLLFMMDRAMGHGAWTDMGMFIQSVMLAAYERGLGTCPQASLTDYPDIVRRMLSLDEAKVLVCGMALGYPDPGDPVNQYRTDRVSSDKILTWHGL